MANTVNAGPRLDRLPTSSFHRRILWLIGGGLFLDAFDVYLAGGVLAALVGSGWSNMQLNANFVTATFVGMLIGSFVAGVLGDAKGRRFTYQFNLALFGLASLAGALAPNMTTLIVCRFVMGIGLGAEIVVSYAMIGEFMPPSVRGKWSAYLSLIANSALFFSTLLGFLIIPNIGWRWMFAIVAVGAAIVWVARKKMPESPRWLESKGQNEEAEKVIAAIEAESAGGQALPSVAVPAGRPPQATNIGSLFVPPLLRRTLLAMIVHITLNIVIYGFIIWVPTFLMKQGFGLKVSLGYSTLMSLGGPAGALLGVFLSDLIGRKRGMIVVAIIAAIVGALYTQSQSVEAAVVLGFILFALTYLLVALGFAAYVPELFPTESRMRGNGIAASAGRVAGMVAPQAVVGLFAIGGITDVLYLIIGALLVMVVALALFSFETSRRTLEEIAHVKA